MNLRHERGAALIELAVVSPVILLLMFGAADFARAYFVGQQLTVAAREGAAAGAVNVGVATSETGTSGAMATAAKNGTNLSGVAANGESFCRCINDTTGVAGSEQACTVACAGGTHAALYARVTTSASFRPVTRFPGIPGTFTVTRKAEQRVVN